MDRRAVYAGAEKLLHDAVRAVAHLREDDYPVPLGMLFEEMRKKRVLLALCDEHHLLVDLLDRRRLWRDRDRRGIVDEFASELEDRRRHCRGEKERLARLRELRDYAPDVWQESHVEHAVRFVEDKALNLVEIEYSLVHQVDEPPRARDNSLRALLDVLDLPVLAHAADKTCERQLRVFGIALHVLGSLHGEFARRREDERARVADAARLPHPHEVVQDRQHERRRLACSRLRTADQVAPVEKIGNRLFLYRRRRLVAGVLYRVLQLLVEPPEYRVLKHIRLCLRVAPSDFVRTEERLLEIVPADKALVRVVLVLAYAVRFREVEHHLAYVLARLEPPLR